jgi:hypothetical protein
MIWHLNTLTITNGTTTSNVLTMADSGYTRDSYTLLFYVPATVAEALVVQVSHDNVTYVTLQSGAVDIALPAGKGTQLCRVAAPFVRVLAGGAVAATRTIPVAYGADN